MKFFAGVKFACDSNRVHHLLLCLQSEAEDGSLEFEARVGSGAFIHIMSNQLKGVDYQEAEEKASSDLGSLQPIGTIELDECDLINPALLRCAVSRRVAQV